MYTILDIETAPIESVGQYIEIGNPPANYKNPEAIREWEDDARIKEVARAALDPDLCRVVAIGWQQSDGVIHSQTANPMTTARNPEEDLLQIFLKLPNPFCGFNLCGFDLPVLMRRCQYLGLRCPDLNLDRYRTPHLDLMERLSFHGRMKSRSLKFYARRLGIPLDDAIDGADVPGLVVASRWDEVKAHIESDVALTATVAEKMGFLR